MLLYIEHENETAIFNSTNVYNLLQYTAVTSSSGIKYLSSNHLMKTLSSAANTTDTTISSGILRMRFTGHRKN